MIAHDPKKLKRFYQNVFDMVLDFETDGAAYGEYIFSDKNIPKFDIEHISLLEVDMPGTEYKGFFLRFEIDDLDDIKQKCGRYGGFIVREPVKQEYGTIEMYCEDPEGNLIQVYKL